MTSRQLQRLNAAIAASASPVETSCLRAERAVLLARMGQHTQARAELAQLHDRFERQPHAAVTAWACLADGLVDHFSRGGPGAPPPSGGGTAGRVDSTDARARLQRARTLAAAAQLAPLRGLCAAWLAHLHYLHSEDELMARSLAEAFGCAAPDHHAARGRAALVAARAYHLVGRAATARAYYAQAREHALAEGDDAGVSAILYDMAGHWVHQAQMAELFGAAGADPRQALLGAESLDAFDRNVGMGTDGAEAAMLRAQALVVQGRHEAALALFENHLEAAVRQGMAHREAPLRADLAWCLQRCGRGDQGRDVARHAEAALLDAVDVDDRALAHARLAQVFAALGLHDVAAQHRADAERAWQVWQQQRGTLEQLLDAALAPVAGGAPAASAVTLRPST